MVGGKVIEVIQLDGETWVDVRDVHDERHTCAIYVERSTNSERIGIGDSLWWQGPWAMWTPKANHSDSWQGPEPRKCGVDYDIQIERIGFSGVRRPEGQRKS